MKRPTHRSPNYSSTHARSVVTDEPRCCFSTIRRLWVDEERASAVTRVDYYVKDRIWNDLLDIDYGETELGWMPRRWTHVGWSTNGPSIPLVTERIEIKETTANPDLPVERFQAKLETGMTYFRTGQPGTWVFQGEGLPPMEVGEYWIKKGWAKKRRPGQKPDEEA